MKVMNEIHRGLAAHEVLTRHTNALYSPEPTLAPEKLAERYIAIWRGAPQTGRTSKIHEPLVKRKRLLAVQGINELVHGQHADVSEGNRMLLWSASYPTGASCLWERNAWGGMGIVLIFSNYLHTQGRDFEGENLTTRGTEVPDLGRYPVVDDSQWWRESGEHAGAHTLRRIYENRVTREELALQLLARLGTSPTQLSTTDLFSVVERDMARFVEAMGLLFQSGAIVLKDDKIILTEQGAGLLEKRRFSHKSSMQQKPGEIKPSSGILLPLIVGALGALGSISFNSNTLRRVVSRLFEGKKYSLKENLNDGLSVACGHGVADHREVERDPKSDKGTRENIKVEISDPNYEAFLRDAKRLENEYGSCIVAYANGGLIAVAHDIKELEEKIPDKYWDAPILIQDIPERVLKMRKRLRVVA